MRGWVALCFLSLASCQPSPFNADRISGGFGAYSIDLTENVSTGIFRGYYSASDQTFILHANTVRKLRPHFLRLWGMSREIDSDDDERWIDLLINHQHFGTFDCRISIGPVHRPQGSMFFESSSGDRLVWVDDACSDPGAQRAIRTFRKVRDIIAADPNAPSLE